ncbi:MAG: hydantoinase/oxoprolinase family protein [Methylocystis sp.]|nr:hydantoinase/oxoprolinase family protein [Methylocystis sp.]MCA3584097.1 hydantoinase/oxoprolinase family protein [Methylocystis sp.]MCA3588943.1 hydantoinase/oxoprolinase family protein [Methylocystis sp.]MCA3591217.1 hydantoinase/oxoprolinase family protein [Methylocystis sp.]
MSGPSTIVGVDVGGTFTDLAFFDEATRRFSTAKVPSNRGDEAVGFIDGLKQLGPIARLGSIVHGTTVGTNALLERKGAKIGVITTPGFRDALEMRRRDRPHTWGLWGDFTPIATREFRLEVPERTLADGTIREAVDTAAVLAACRELLAKGAEALAIVFINSYANAANERAAYAAARTLWPNEHVTHSAQILPEFREFERTSTVALNAYLQPVVASYLGKLEKGLAEEAFDGSFHIVQSNGGIMSTALARRFPVRTALSGPAAGVIAAAAIAKAAGYPDIITADLGGTSFDVSVVANGEAALAAQTTIDFGLIVRTPMIEITTIGAGGGSIAHVDQSGFLSVGPESAGSRPGPVAYGQGNTRPTLTDANIVLGRINAGKPIGGKLERLDVAAARAAIGQSIGEPLGLSPEAAAEAIIRVANARMAGAIRLVSVERGHDPAKFTAVPFGGGGALHVGALLAEVGLKAALVPRYPGITSALGCIIADARHDQVSTLNLMLEGLDGAALGKRMAEAGAEAHAIVAGSGLTVERIDVLYELDMHYQGQTHTVSVPLPVAMGEPVTEDIVRAAFETAYAQAFSRLLPGIPVRIVNLRTAAVGRRPVFDMAALAPEASANVGKAFLGRRPVWFAGAWQEAGIWDRLALPVGALVKGPAILEQGDATTVLDPGLKATVDVLGNLIVERA